MYRCLITRKKAILIGLFILATSPIASAEVTMDGILGPAGPLAGPHYAIPAELGQQHGSNLFHSFNQFSILSGESATFSGPDSVQNLIGRVTGGTSSTIDGTIRSTIPGASLYLINPVGVLLGEQAQVDVGGSFYVS
ncbi:MAG: filamentous hemagglutinin N-terminal domain-containing protein, partial [Candidatus Competibacteraceae bacterium]|nr:filamentous hemagglutinin N-terminal domain-containing protein [Candidatus Competibacteraceae bacterium]